MVDTGLVTFGLIGLTSGSLLQVSVLVVWSAVFILSEKSRQIISKLLFGYFQSEVYSVRLAFRFRRNYSLTVLAVPVV